MVRIRSAIPIGLVAAVTGCRQGCVVVVRMALRALQCGVGTGEWEGRVVVIERRWDPGSRRVTDRAVRRKSG